MNDWNIKVEMKHVMFAKKLLKNPLFECNMPVMNNRDGKNYTLRDVYVSGYSVKDVKTDKGTVDKGAVFFRIDTGLLQLGFSYYPPLNFSIPKSQLIKFETDEMFIDQEITITEWCYENCYMLPINKVYEDWGKRMKSMLNYYDTDAWDNAPMYLYSPYRSIIEKIEKKKVSDMVKDYVKKEEKTKNIVAIKKKGKYNNKQRNDEANFREEAVYTFQVDGSANITSNKPFKDYGHYSVVLKNTDERWKRKEVWLTSNAAELKGVISAMYISIKRGYKNVVIETDSNNCVQWFEENWKVKADHIIPLVKKMLEFKENIQNVRLRKIDRSRNLAHAI